MLPIALSWRDKCELWILSAKQNPPARVLQVHSMARRFGYVGWCYLHVPLTMYELAVCAKAEWLGTVVIYLVIRERCGEGEGHLQDATSTTGLRCQTEMWQMKYVRKSAKESRGFCWATRIIFSEDAVSGWSESRILLKINLIPRIKYRKMHNSFNDYFCPF